MGAHALFSPSSAARWMRCVGSVALSKDITDDRTSEFAAEGTAAHDLAAMAFTAGLPAAEFIGTPIHADRFDFIVDEEMAEHVQTYLDNCARDPGQHECEIKVPLSGVLQTENQFGTADRVALDVEKETIYVRDLKYGQGVQVYAEGNEQLMLYAAGAAVEYEALANWKHFVIGIEQPRLGHRDEWAFERTALISFIKHARAQVKAGMALLESDDVREHLTPGPEQCKWCPAAGSCSAYAESVHAETAAYFDDVTGMTAEDEKSTAGLMTDQEIAEALKNVDWVKGWVKAVEAEAHARAIGGATLPGWKLVQGRAGARKWVDDEAAEERLKKSRLKADEMYDRKLISPTKAEKLLAKAKPRVWKKVEDLITRSDGHLHLAPEGDKRPAQAPAGVTADDFDDVTGA